MVTDRAEYQERAAESVFERAGKFLDREHHARKRRIERRCNTRGAAGERKPRHRARVAKAQTLCHRHHQSGTHVHRRSLAPDRSAYQHRHQRQHELADGNR